jgi:hypothetical protein
MKRDIVDVAAGYDASDEEESGGDDSSLEEEEGGGASYRAGASCSCCCCQSHEQTNKGGLCRSLLVLTYLSFIVLAVHRVNHVLTQSNDKHEMAYTIGGAFVVATVPISLYQIFQHLSHFVEPKQQTHVIRMISMVPLYAIQSWCSLRYQSLSLYTQCVREAYESYVIYAFVQYLISYMGSEEQLIVKLQTKPAVLGRHMAPFCCLPAWAMGAEFLHRCKAGVLQYLGVRLATLLLTFLLEYLELYGEGEYSVRRGFFWVTVVNCVSQTWALYILILFYHATHKELISINPCGKFFAIKSVVFASWWQSLFIGLMVHQGTIGELDSHSAEMVAKGVQDLLICTEMLMAAMAFTFAFPVSDFVNPIEPAYLKEPWVPLHMQLQHPHQHHALQAGATEHGGGLQCDASGAALLGGKGKGKGKGSSGGSVGGAQRGGDGGLVRGSSMSIWTALWTSCVPMDVREDFKLATQRCLDEDPCFCITHTACWPCRCKFRCGHRPHRSHRGASRAAAAAGGGGGVHRQSSAGAGGGLGPSGSGVEGGNGTRSSAAVSMVGDRSERGLSTGGAASSEGSRRMV